MPKTPDIDAAASKKAFARGMLSDSFRVYRQPNQLKKRGGLGLSNGQNKPLLQSRFKNSSEKEAQNGDNQSEEPKEQSPTRGKKSLFAGSKKNANLNDQSLDALKEEGSQESSSSLTRTDFGHHTNDETESDGSQNSFSLMDRLKTAPQFGSLKERLKNNPKRLTAPAGLRKIKVEGENNSDSDPSNMLSEVIVEDNVEASPLINGNAVHSDQASRKNTLDSEPRSRNYSLTGSVHKNEKVPNAESNDNEAVNTGTETTSEPKGDSNEAPEQQTSKRVIDVTSRFAGLTINVGKGHQDESKDLAKPDYLNSLFGRTHSMSQKSAGSPLKGSPHATNLRKTDSEKVHRMHSELFKEHLLSKECPELGEKGSKTPKAVREMDENEAFKARKENFLKDRGLAPLKTAKHLQTLEDNPARKEKQSPLKLKKDPFLEDQISKKIPSSLFFHYSNCLTDLNIPNTISEHTNPEGLDNKLKEWDNDGEEEGEKEEGMEMSPYFRGYYSDTAVKRFRGSNKM